VWGGRTRHPNGKVIADFGKGHLITASGWEGRTRHPSGINGKVIADFGHHRFGLGRQDDVPAR